MLKHIMIFTVLPRFFFSLRLSPLVTSYYIFLFVSRGQRWWTRFCTQSASQTVWRSSLWKMQDSNRRFPLPWHYCQPCHLLWFNLLSSPVLLLTPSPLRHSSHSPLLFPQHALLFSALSLSPLVSSFLTSISPHHLSSSHLSTAPHPPLPPLSWPFQFCLSSLFSPSHLS